MTATTKKRKLTLAAAENKAVSYIKAENQYVFDVCANYGQIFENVRDTAWFRDMVAASLLCESLEE